MQLLKKACTMALCTVLTAGVGFAQHGRDDHNNGRDDHANFHFQQNDRSQWQKHYSSDMRRWQNNRNRPHYSAGQRLSRTDVSRFRAVPSSYYRGAPPLPRGYRYGYYEGNVVAYNPVTMLVADVIDLINQ